MLKNTKSNNTFVTILSDGTMRVAVPEGTEGSVRREYETKDGAKGVKHEMVYTELEGKITGISFYEGDYGKLLQLTVTDDNNDQVLLSVGTESNFGEDLMKKLPAIDLEQPVKIVPYSFEDDNKKKKRGVTVYQNEEKVANFFTDEDRKPLHGFPPIPKKKKITTDDWKLYFMNVRVFLIEYITENLATKKEMVAKDQADEDFENVGKE